MNALISKFQPISLSEMGGIKLMNRTDTKFVTSIDKLMQLLQMAGDEYRVQEIDGKRNMSYATIYYDSKEMDRYHLGIATDYKLNKYLKLSAGYNLLYDHRGNTQTYHKDGTVNKITPSYWWPRHRFLFGVTGSYSFGNLGVSLREMYQYTYRSKAKDKKYDTDTEEWEDVKSKSQHLLRSRFQLNYRLKHTPFTPFGSVELYHGEGGLQKTRYTLGTSYSIAKHHSLKLYYRYQDLRQNDDDDLDTHVLGIGYSYQF